MMEESKKNKLKPPTYLPRISHVQAGLQPACLLLRVCNPHKALFRFHYP